MLTARKGATQSATCCTTCKKGSVGIGHKRFENVGNVSPIPRNVFEFISEFKIFFEKIEFFRVI